MARFPKNDIMSLTAETVRYDLAESVGPDIHVGELLEAPGLEGFGDIALSYGTAAGDPALRALLAEIHGVDPDDVVITVGGMHALFLLAFILCGQGDEAVVATPVFPPARSSLEAVGATVKDLPLSFDQGYQLNLDNLRGMLSKKTKLVSLASPQNPSGVALPNETIRVVLAEMAEWCLEAYLLLDTTYREATFGADVTASSGVDLNPKVISCASLSKCHGAPGLRLGWAITRDPLLREQLVVGKFNTVISNSRVDEALALKVLQQREHILHERRGHLAAGLAKTETWVNDHDGLVEWVRPDAGALCCVRLKSAAFDDAAVQRFYDTLAGEGVRVGNGAWFGEQPRVFRLGFGLLSMADLETALNSLSAALRQSARDTA